MANARRNKKDLNDKLDASDDDPVGCCRYTDANGELVCVDDLTKSECHQYPNSIFIPGGKC